MFGTTWNCINTICSRIKRPLDFSLDFTSQAIKASITAIIHVGSYCGLFYLLLCLPKYILKFLVEAKRTYKAQFTKAQTREGAKECSF